MDRRRFLQLSGAAGMAYGLGACAGSEDPIVAGSWGNPTDEQLGLMLPENRRMEGALEIYLMGGFCPWDTFYVVPEYGEAEKHMWWTFQQGPESVPEFWDICGGPGGDMLKPFGFDANGKGVYLGPWTYPLWDRPDILSRMRTMVMQHPFEPHQVASPLMLCGFPRGTPRMSATGAHVQRYHQGMQPERATPHSYVLFSSDTEVAAEFDAGAAQSSGIHPASASPLAIRLVGNNPLPGQLKRDQLGGFADSVDSAMAQFIARYRSTLKQPNRSVALAELAAARRSLAFGPQLAKVLTPEVLAPMHGQECGYTTEDAGVMDTTAMGLRLATHLLTHPDERASYVQFVDSGMINATGAGYDTHDFHVRESSRNMVHFCKKLAEIINKPGEGDPNKLDLDRHTVWITSEFGRRIFAEPGRIRGLNHHPNGFAVMAIGGWVDEERAGVVGAIGPDGVATSGFTPTELRAASLLSQNVWPFALEGFAIGDIRTSTQTSTSLEAAASIRSAILGYPV